MQKKKIDAEILLDFSKVYLLNLIQFCANLGLSTSFLAFNSQRQKWPWFQEGNKSMENSRAIISAAR